MNPILDTEEAKEYCLSLMDTLEKEKRLDFNIPLSSAVPELSTGILFSEARGQMFGALVCKSRKPEVSRKIVIKAFSGQYNGIWEVEGWAPPVINSAEFQRAASAADPEIKALGRKILNLPYGAERDSLIRQRKLLSQKHMREIHKLYTIRNFAGGSANLFSLFRNRSGIPAGTGDCCAPKLLNQAIQLGLKPVSLAEFFWGAENKSGTKKHGCFYPPCNDKCEPLLAFMLQGLQQTAGNF